MLFRKFYFQSSYKNINKNFSVKFAKRNRVDTVEQREIISKFIKYLSRTVTNCLTKKILTTFEILSDFLFKTVHPEILNIENNLSKISAFFVN